MTGIIGFAKALELAEKTRASEVKRLQAIRAKLRSYLLDSLPDVQINENRNANSPAILNLSVAGVDGERVVFALDEKGVQVATGSACAANKGLRSHILVALGLTDEQADGSIRLSMGRFTAEDDAMQAGKLIVEELMNNDDLG